MLIVFTISIKKDSVFVKIIFKFEYIKLQDIGFIHLTMDNSHDPRNIPKQKN